MVKWHLFMFGRDVYRYSQWSINVVTGSSLIWLFHTYSTDCGLAFENIFASLPHKILIIELLSFVASLGVFARYRIEDTDRQEARQ